MAIKIEDRPTETVREEVIDQLIMNYSHGVLSYEAFERRLDQAMETNDNKLLISLVEDLELHVDKEYVETKKKDLGFSFTPGDTEELDYLINIFSGSSRSGAWKIAKEIRAFSIFSGGDIDLTQAQFTQPVHRIKIFSLFSGDTIYVPEHINVVTKAFCIFGGIDNSAPSTNNPNAPTLIIEGLSIFSGVNIELKRTIKERFVEFADQLKKMFS